METEILEIDLVYDIICPWCYVGHQRLLNAIQKTNSKVHINLIPFQLRPHISQKGIAIKEYWEAKGITNITLAYEKVIEAAESENLNLDPSKFSTLPNTLKIHQVLLKAEELNVGLKVLHAIQRAYFSFGADLTSLESMITITRDYLSEKEVKEAWEDVSTYKNLVISKEQHAKSLNITSVPTYVINKQHRIAGAVSNYTLRDMLHQLAPKIDIGEFCDIETGIC